jgi:hypothetical protein
MPYDGSPDVYSDHRTVRWGFLRKRENNNAGNGKGSGRRDGR